MDIDEDARRRIESFVADWMTDAGVPGAALAVVDADGVAYAEGFGSRDRDSNAPATPDTLFGVGSVTKTVTSTAVLRLVERGEVALEDAVAEYVDVAGEVPGDPVTVRELLTHTSGLPSDGRAVALITRALGVPGPTPPLGGERDFERHVREASADRLTDRERFCYYNSGYTMLGDLVASVTGREYGDYAIEELLRPLGIERATFHRDAFEADENAMTPYRLEDGSPTPADFPFDERTYAPGGLLASAREVATWVRCHLRGGELDGTRVLEADLAREAREGHAVRETFLDGTEARYGYGWMTRPFLDDTLVGHGGSIGVSRAYAGYLADAGVGVALLCNAGADPHPMDVAPAVLALLCGADETAVPTFALDAKLDPLVGEYAAFRGTMTATVERTGGTLRLSVGDEQVLTLAPTSLDPEDRTFRAVSETGADKPVEFLEGEEGYDLLVDRWRLRPTSS